MVYFCKVGQMLLRKNPIGQTLQLFLIFAIDDLVLFLATVVKLDLGRRRRCSIFSVMSPPNDKTLTAVSD
ncbi:MAG: hypothetical protein A3H24_12290 [Rhodoferax sp. RIFCSPLOWO2_12_FULL_60_11]|nr:MAG: hypothetical protein A3H24_12290 [Rhodoferax sp. RIFCSPLOWO2_12_FULL_60_11]